MIYAVENGDYAVTDHVPRRLDAPENLVQSLRLLLALGRRAVCDVPGVLVLGVRTADGSAVFRLWVREKEREVTVAL